MTAPSALTYGSSTASRTVTYGGSTNSRTANIYDALAYDTDDDDDDACIPSCCIAHLPGHAMLVGRDVVSTHKHSNGHTQHYHRAPVTVQKQVPYASNTDIGSVSVVAPTSRGKMLKSVHRGKWVDAETVELDGHDSIGTFEYVNVSELPKHGGRINILPTMWKCTVLQQHACCT